MPLRYWAVSAWLAFGMPVPACPKPQVDMRSRQWSLESDSRGICIYACRVQGTGIVPFKSVMTIPASIEEISAVLEDISRRGEWIVRFGESRLIERKNDYDQTEYLRMSMPWPLTDRTAFVRVQITVSDDLRTASIAGRTVSGTASAELPELVRAEIYESTFQMTVTPGGTEVSALIFIDPRGNLPQWAVNFYTKRVSRGTLEGLRRQVAKKLYSEEVLKALRHRIKNYAAFKGEQGL